MQSNQHEANNAAPSRWLALPDLRSESMLAGIEHRVIVPETLAVVDAQDHPLAVAKPLLADLMAGD